MKPYSIALALILCAMNAKGQSSTADDLLSKMNDPRTVGTTKGTESRLLGVYIQLFDGSKQPPGERAYITYTDDNAWDTLLNEWRYDTATFVWVNGGNYPQDIGSTIFDTNKRITTRLFHDHNGTNMVGKTMYHYDAQGRVIGSENGYEYHGMFSVVRKATNTYNAQGQLSEIIREFYHNIAWRPNTRTVMNYNSGLLDKETIYEWNPVDSLWNEASRKYYYYADTVLTSVLQEVSFQSGWKKSDSVIFVRNGTGQLIEEETKHWYDSSGWTNSRKILRMFDTIGNVINRIEQYAVGNSYKNKGQIFTRYNSFNQVVFEAQMSWDSLNGSFQYKGYQDHETHYYYGQFNTGTKDEVAERNGLQVYPNPANTTLTIALNTNQPQQADILLLDMTGKVAGRWTTAQRIQTVDISHVPSGVYMLKVTSTQGGFSQQVTIVR